MSAAVLVLLPAGAGDLLAQAQPGGPGAGRGEEFGKTSPIALVVILLLGLATFLLIRSMNRRLKNIPASFDGADRADDGGAGPGPAGDAGREVPNGSPGAPSDGGGPPARTDGAPPTGSP